MNYYFLLMLGLGKESNFLLLIILFLLGNVLKNQELLS